MQRRRTAKWRLASLAVLGAAIVHAAGGTDRVATPGHDAYISPGWPEGTAALVNDSLRTNGWNDWFSEWPSDVTHFEYQVRTMDDVNALIEKLAAIPEHQGCVVLSPHQEPRGLGWVTSLPEGNGTAVLLSVGDQPRVDQWYQRLPDGKFGVMRFTSCPVAVPPTLTIYVGNPLIDLTELQVPQGLSVTEGHAPRYFMKWNRKVDTEKSSETKSPSTNAEAVPPDVQRAVEAIQSFLEQRAVESAPAIPDGTDSR